MGEQSRLLARFTIPGAPVGKARPRVTRTGHAFTPKKTTSYEAMVRLLSLSGWSGPEFTGAVLLEVVVYHEPKGKGRAGWAIAANGHRPDLDNVVKAVSDGIQATTAGKARVPVRGVIADDRQIVAIVARSLYAGPGTSPRVEVRVSEAPLIDPIRIDEAPGRSAADR